MRADLRVEYSEGAIWLAISLSNNLCWNESFGDWDNKRLSFCVIVISMQRKLLRDTGHCQLWIWKPIHWAKPHSFQTVTAWHNRYPLLIPKWLPVTLIQIQVSLKSMGVVNYKYGCLITEHKLSVHYSLAPINIQPHSYSYMQQACPWGGVIINEGT